MHILDKGSSSIVESTIVRAFKTLDALTSEEPLSLALVNDNLKRQANEIPSVRSLLDRSKIVTPGPAGEPLSCLPIILQHTFLPEHQYVPCIFMNSY